MLLDSDAVTKYRTVCADPPWRYRKDGHDTRGDQGLGGGVMRWAEQNYRTMSNAEIRDLPVKDYVADSAHCYLWVTAPRLFGERNDRSISPVDILEAWGFDYRTTLVWLKRGAPGMGSYFRVDTEFVIFGVRGQCVVPPSLRRSNVIVADKGRHSEKPEAFYALVEHSSPGPRLDMFARCRREGWASFGDQVPDFMQRRMWPVA